MGKICKFDESVFLIDGVYRGRNRVYNGADNVEKMILCVFAMVRFTKGENLFAYLFL